MSAACSARLMAVQHQQQALLPLTLRPPPPQVPLRLAAQGWQQALLPLALLPAAALPPGPSKTRSLAALPMPTAQRPANRQAPVLMLPPAIATATALARLPSPLKWADLLLPRLAQQKPRRRCRCCHRRRCHRAHGCGASAARPGLESTQHSVSSRQELCKVTSCLLWQPRNKTRPE